MKAVERLHFRARRAQIVESRKGSTMKPNASTRSCCETTDEATQPTPLNLFLLSSRKDVRAIRPMYELKPRTKGMLGDANVLQRKLERPGLRQRALWEEVRVRGLEDDCSRNIGRGVTVQR